MIHDARLQLCMHQSVHQGRDFRVFAFAELRVQTSLTLLSLYIPWRNALPGGKGQGPPKRGGHLKSLLTGALLYKRRAQGVDLKAQ